MKKTKKLLAFVLTIAMIAVMVPFTAIAATTAEHLDAITIKGVTVEFPEDGFEFADARAGTIYLPLTLAQMTGAGANSATLDTPGSATASLQIFADGNDALVIDAATARTLGVALTATAPVSVGSVIWVASSSEDSLVRIVISVVPDGTITGETTVQNPIFNVILPLNLNFALDPMQAGNTTPANGNQISGSDYRIVNRSGFAVRASFEITATKNAGLETVARGVAPAETTPARTGFFGVLGASSVTPSPTWAAPNTGVYAFNPITASELNGTLIPINWTTTTAGNANIAFILGAADPLNATPALAALDAGVAAFQFYGELNTMALWATTDLTFTGAYRLTGVLPPAYDAAVVPANIVGLNMVRPAPAGPTPNVTFTTAPPQTQSATVSRAAGSWTVQFPSPFPTGITSVGGGNAWLATDYTYVAATGLLTITRYPAGTTASPITIVTTGTNAGTYTVTLTPTA
jgi:hypothetical protein